jgi:hypothetical protein
MACALADIGIKAGQPYFGSWYFHFWKSSSNTFTDVSMIEHPTQTLYFRLYDAAYNFLEEIKGAGNERFHEARPQGEYYLQVLTDPGNAHNPNGGNTARVISRFRPAERSPEQVRTFEWPAGSQTANYQGNVFSIAARLTSEANVKIEFGKEVICPLGNLEEQSLNHSFDEIRVGNVPAGTYSVSLTMKNGVHWYPEFAAYRKRGNEPFEKISDGKFMHSGGTLTLGVGYYNTVEIPTDGDRYAEYDLTITKQ